MTSIRSRLRNIPVRALLAAIALGALAPIVLIGGYSLYDTAQSERRRASDTVEKMARSLADAVERQLKAYRELAESLATGRHLTSGDLKVFEEVARDTAERSRVAIVLIDREYRQVVNTRLPPGLTPPHTQQKDNVDAVLSTGRPFVTDMRQGTTSRRETIAILVPVTIDGTVRYALALAPELSVLGEIIDELGLPEGWLAGLLDRGHRTLARSQRPEQFVGQHAPFWDGVSEDAGLRETVDREGRPSITAFTRVPSSGWRAVVWAPKAVLYEPSRRLTMWALALFAASLATSLAIAALLGRHIDRPIGDLSKAAKLLGEGKPVAVAASYMREANAVGAALVKASDDIAERERALRDALAHSHYLMRELAHRMKNQMALIVAVARQTGRSTANPKDFGAAFEQRLMALSHSADLLLANDWRHARLADLVELHLRGLAEPQQIEAEGPDVLLRPEATQHLGMALHELATNSTKYGALSAPGGRVRVTWSTAAGQLAMRWEERGGPAVKEPERQGFGRMVVGRMISSALDAKAASDFRPEGLVWTFEAPLDRIV